MIEPSQKLVRLVDTVRKRDPAVAQLFKCIFPPEVRTYPIPFFGPLNYADVLTLSLSPSTTEFSKERDWPQVISNNQLAARLVNYFSLPEIKGHNWFSDLDDALWPIGRSYSLNCAHIDVSPWPTLSPSALKKRESGIRDYDSLLMSELPFLETIIAHSLGPKLLIVVNTGRWERQIMSFLQKCIACELVFLSKNEVKSWVLLNKQRLLRLLGGSKKL